MGSRQQDGKLPAAKRLLPRLRQAYPPPRFWVFGDDGTDGTVMVVLSDEFYLSGEVGPGQIATSVAI